MAQTSRAVTSQPRVRLVLDKHLCADHLSNIPVGHVDKPESTPILPFARLL
jgi:hypothetical protein